MENRKVNDKIYEIYMLSGFFDYYKNRAAIEVFKGITRTIQHVTSTHFYIGLNQAPMYKYSLEGQYLNSRNKTFCAFSKKEVCDYLEKLKIIEENELINRDLKKIKYLEEQLNKAKEAAKNRTNHYWKEFNDKVSTIEDMKKL